LNNFLQEDLKYVSKATGGDVFVSYSPNNTFSEFSIME